ncbi:MAG: enoyl-CoA hydratase/isomerase family protein [Propionibacteriaceae bacterium]
MTEIAESMWVASSSGELRTCLVSGVAHAQLHRPRAINALTSTLVADLRAALGEWADDDEVDSVVLEGVGEKGFCAGGDVRACREFIIAGNSASAASFWHDEYALLREVRHYNKPVIAIQHGVVMGGGIGLSAAAADSISDANACFAMPETQIGFIPDAGAMFFLSRAGNLGRHLALSGATTNTGDAIAVGFSQRCSTTAPMGTFAQEEWLAAYDASDPAEVIERLQSYQSQSADDAAALLASRSPLMVKITARALEQARTMTWDEVLIQDFTIASHVMEHPDFSEGVRAQLVDKDRNPSWRHTNFDEVTATEVDSFFG